MQTLILTLHIIVCFLLVILILLQSGKEGMGVIFGGGNSSVFGSAGAGGILAKLTTLMAIIFVITSLSYTYVTSSHTESESQILNVRIEEVEPEKPAPEAAPAQPASPVQPEVARPADEAPPVEQAGAKDQESAAPADAKPEAEEPRPAAGGGESAPAPEAEPAK